MNNEMKLSFTAITENESFARVSIASFVSILNPSMDTLSDIKTAVSEAITNCIVHAYPHIYTNKVVDVHCVINNNQFTITIKDYGIGIEDVLAARKPFYTSKPNTERSGIGFTVMEGFMDSVDVVSSVGKGTTVTMTKLITEQNVECGG